MNELEDLPRRLAELAESGGPWDDPLPEVRRRVDAADATTRAAVLSPRRWRITGPTVLALAAALVLVVGLGALLQHKPTPSEKSSSAAARAAAPANGSASNGSASNGSAAGGNAGGGRDSAASGVCGPLGRYDLTRTVGTLSLSAPSRVGRGRPLTVQALLMRVGSTAPATVADLRVFVLTGGRVVGELATTSAPVPTTAVPPGAIRHLSATGALGPSDGNAVCAPPTRQGRPPSPGLPQPSPSRQPVPPGDYQLVAALAVQASASGAGVVLSQPIDITVY